MINTVSYENVNDKMKNERLQHENNITINYITL